MLSIQKILHATDFSPSSQAALPIACSLARDYRAALILLHVRPSNVVPTGEFGTLPPETRESDAAVTAKLRELLPPDFKGRVEFQVRDGNAADEIVATATQISCDMIVLGTHGRTGLTRLLLGSVADAVLRSATCPVLTIKSLPAQVSAKSAPAKPAVAETKPTMDATDLMTVCSVASPAEASVIHNALKSEGIRAFIEGGTQAGLTGTLGIPINIQVPVADFDRASRFIRTHEAHRR